MCCRSLHLVVLWVVFENVMSMHRTKATFIGLLEIGTVNEWVVTEKLGDALKTKLSVKATKKRSTGIGERYISSLAITYRCSWNKNMFTFDNMSILLLQNQWVRAICWFISLFLWMLRCLFWKEPLFYIFLSSIYCLFCGRIRLCWHICPKLIATPKSYLWVRWKQHNTKLNSSTKSSKQRNAIRIRYDKKPNMILEVQQLEHGTCTILVSCYSRSRGDFLLD